MRDKQNNFRMSEDVALCKPFANKNIRGQLNGDFAIELPQNSLLDVFEGFKDCRKLLERHFVASNESSE